MKGGVAIYFHKSLPYVVRDYLSINVEKNLNPCSLKSKTKSEMLLSVKYIEFLMQVIGHPSKGFIQFLKKLKNF